MQSKSTFVLDRFEQADPHSEEEGVAFSRAEIGKTFSGELSGTSTVEMLAARSPDGGAGYVALERISATIDERSGTFALLHMGTMHADGRWAKWPIVPGSGTGDLKGIRGEGHIDIDADGTHHFILDYDFS